jgi:hypothetical protein
MIYKFLRFTNEELNKIYTTINSFLCDVIYKERDRMNEVTEEHLQPYKRALDEQITCCEGILQRITNESKERHEDKKFKFIIYFKATRDHNVKPFGQFCFVEAKTAYEAKKIAWEQHTQIDRFWAFEILDCIALSSINQINTEMLDELMKLKYKGD